MKVTKVNIKEDKLKQSKLVKKLKKASPVQANGIKMKKLTKLKAAVKGPGIQNGTSSVGGKKNKNVPVELKVPKNKENAVKKVKKAEKGMKKPISKDKKKKKKSLKEDIEGLKDIDPEFYDFLKKNDQKLLDFDLSDSDDFDEDESDNKKKKAQSKSGKKDAVGSDDEGSDDEEKYHKPSGELEVASDESDFEGSDEETTTKTGQQKVTLSLLREWQRQLEKPNVSVDLIRKVIQAFSSALISITAENDEAQSLTSFKVVGPATFNGVVQLCVLHLQPAILRFLGLSPRATTPLHKTKKWVKVRSCLRYYLTDLIRLVEQVSSPNILSVLLKHLHQMSAMVASFSTLGKTILKRLISLWATGDETVRVLAFLCILKITRNQQVSMLNHVLKAMYLSYVRNSKFVSPNTLPSINFMRRSLVEMFALDLNVSYQHSFLYIRQLAIHLRNAVILKKKDSFQAVYNWQFVNSLRLWADLLSVTFNKPQLQPLIFPLVTITLGVIRLIPTAQYFPLRFHCIQSLISLAKATHTFIPVLPLILEVLKSNTFNRKHTAVSMRPQQFTCLLRLNKSQLAENGFRDEVVEQVCGLTLDYMAHESASLAFSDLAVPAIVSLKAYLKDCRNANHSRKLKQLLDKIQENARFMDQQRRKITFGLNDIAQVNAWEVQVRNKGTPLSIYYDSWIKTHETKKRRQAAQIDTINSDYDLPTIAKKKSKTNVANQNGEVELFPSDSEDDLPSKLMDDNDDDDDTEKPVPKTDADKKKKKKKKQVVQEQQENLEQPEEDEDVDANVDIVKDLDLDDW